MAELIRIGNSRGVRIPKSLIQQAKLEGQKLEFTVLEDGLLIKRVKKQLRAGWAERIEKMLSQMPDGEMIDNEWLNAPLIDDDEWEW